jgi:superfamily I DNA/RNA helicase
MRLPAWSELIEEQRNVSEHPLDKSLFVVGPPGSGKTTLAIQRAEMLKNASKETTIITYNRMLRRLISAVTKNQIIASTMQSYVWRHYRSHAGGNPPRGQDNFTYIWPAMKAVFDANKYNVSLLDHIVIDEGQDLPKDFFEYSACYIANALTVFADEDQAVNENSTSLEQIRIAAGLPMPFMLKENHRNSPEIARVAEHFHTGGLPAATVRRKVKGSIPTLAYEPSNVSVAKRIATWYANRAGHIGVIVKFDQTGQDLLNKLADILTSVRIDYYSNRLKNEDSIQIISPGITILNQESVKGQEFDTVFICELQTYVPINTPKTLRIMYMMCCRARDHLFMLYGPNQLTEQAFETLPGNELLTREPR